MYIYSISVVFLVMYLYFLLSSHLFPSAVRCWPHACWACGSPCTHTWTPAHPAVAPQNQVIIPPSTLWGPIVYCRRERGGYSFGLRPSVRHGNIVIAITPLILDRFGWRATHINEVSRHLIGWCCECDRVIPPLLVCHLFSTSHLFSFLYTPLRGLGANWNHPACPFVHVRLFNCLSVRWILSTSPKVLSGFQPNYLHQYPE
jgi:hypothetical protein